MWTLGIKFKDGWRFARNRDGYGWTWTEFESGILWFDRRDAAEQELLVDGEVKVLDKEQVQIILAERVKSYDEREAV